MIRKKDLIARRTEGFMHTSCFGVALVLLCPILLLIKAVQSPELAAAPSHDVVVEGVTNAGTIVLIYCTNPRIGNTGSIAYSATTVSNEVSEDMNGEINMAYTPTIFQLIDFLNNNFFGCDIDCSSRIFQHVDCRI